MKQHADSSKVLGDRHGFFQGTLHKCLEVSQNCCFVNKRRVGWQNAFLRKLNSVFFTENIAGDSTIKNKL